ncbi:MAG: ribosome biogenesis GTPase YlqF [Candidatus Eremiobacteraeota bacterium]|nr:ribosome biogenesis GTPase YlqF [Candidatus Eremiobacteraeota bacterium]
MVQTTRRIKEYLRVIDIVIEVVDARIPRSGRAPLLDQLAARRARVVALSRDDLADPAATRLWLEDLAARGAHAVAIDARKRGGVARLADAIGATSRLDGRAAKVARAMIVGPPNSGKSTIVNALLRRAAAKTEDRAGVTRQLQWFRLAPNVELMDTPGVLPPKISDVAAQWKLALCGAVPRNRYDPAAVVGAFHCWLVERRPRTSVPDLETFAEARGFVRRGGETDYHNAAASYISAFNDGVFGRISLEIPDDAEAA